MPSNCPNIGADLISLKKQRCFLLQKYPFKHFLKRKVQNTLNISQKFPALPFRSNQRRKVSQSTIYSKSIKQINSPLISFSYSMMSWGTKQRILPSEICTTLLCPWKFFDSSLIYYHQWNSLCLPFQLFVGSDC